MRGRNPRPLQNSGPADACGEIVVDADPDTAYRLITDLPTLAELAEEAEAMRWRQGTGAHPGAVFEGRNRNGWRRWMTTCTVTAAEAGRVFAFDVRSVVPGAHWRYDLEPTDGGCRVTERTWDHRPRWIRRLADLIVGVPDRAAANSDNIHLTLQRLKSKAESTTARG